MKKLLILAILFLSGCAAAPPVSSPVPVNKDWTISITFNYDFTNYVPCSASVTAGCINGFTWGYIQGTTQIPLRTSAPTICTGTTQPESCSDTANATLGIGPVTYYVIANGVNNAGAAVSSTPGSSAVDNVTLISATNVAASRK